MSKAKFGPLIIHIAEKVQNRR